MFSYGSLAHAIIKQLLNFIRINSAFALGVHTTLFSFGYTFSLTSADHCSLELAKSTKHLQL